MTRRSSSTPRGSQPSGADELEHLEELGDDAIIAQQTAAHAPQPRAQVTEETRSIVIAEGQSGAPAPTGRSRAHGSSRKRSDRHEKTVVIRDRRALQDMRREMNRRAPRSKSDAGLLVWIVVGAAAFLMGGLVALFATRSGSEGAADPQPSGAAAPPAATPTAAHVKSETEPPSVSIDQLPVERSQAARK